MRSIRSGFGLIVDEGPVLAAARLALARAPRRGLAFADRWRPAPRSGGRVLCSVPLANAWPRGRALGMPWGVPLQLGNLTVATGPAGSTPEAAVLRVQLDERLLVCGLAARGQALPGSLPADVAGADVLLLDGAGLRHAGSPDALALQAVSDLAQRGGGVILLDDTRLAAAIAHALPASTPLYTTAALGRRIDLLVARPSRRLGRRLAAGGVLLWPRGRPLPGSAALATVDRLHLIAPGAEPATELEGGGAYRTPWPSVAWSAAADETSLVALIEASGADDVVVWHGRAADVRKLSGVAARLWHLVPQAQLPLV